MGTVQIIKESILPRQTKRRIYYTKKFLITSALLHNGNTLAAKILVTIITFVQNDIGSEFLLALKRNAVFFYDGQDKSAQDSLLANYIERSQQLAGNKWSSEKTMFISNQ